jgi:hypothetical protein
MTKEGWGPKGDDYDDNSNNKIYAIGKVIHVVLNT